MSTINSRGRPASVRIPVSVMTRSQRLLRRAALMLAAPFVDRGELPRRSVYARRPEDIYLDDEQSPTPRVQVVVLEKLGKVPEGGKLEKIGEALTETAVHVAAAVGIAFPLAGFLGGAAARGAELVLERRQNGRLADFIEKLATDLRRLEARLNKTLHAEDVEDFAEDAFTKAATMRDSERRDALRAIFLNAVLSEAPNFNETSEISDLVARWRDRHIILLRVLANPAAADADSGGTARTASGFLHVLGRLLPRWTPDEITRTWQDLHRDRIHNTETISGITSGRGTQLLENRLTPFGRKVAAYITIPD